MKYFFCIESFSDNFKNKRFFTQQKMFNTFENILKFWTLPNFQKAQNIFTSVDNFLLSSKKVFSLNDLKMKCDNIIIQKKHR